MDKDSGMVGTQVYDSEINEAAKTLRQWVRRKRGNRKLDCSVVVGRSTKLLRSTSERYGICRGQSTARRY